MTNSFPERPRHSEDHVWRGEGNLSQARKEWVSKNIGPRSASLLQRDAAAFLLLVITLHA